MLTRQDRYAYAPIHARPDYVWPGGKRLAIYFALGLEDYDFLGGMTEDILPGASRPDYVNTSWRDYGNRVGAFRLFDLFGAQRIPLTVLLNTALYDTAPALTDAARGAGCEVVAHGYANSDTLAGRSPDDEAAYIRTVSEAIEAREGAPPRGWSSPWLAHTDITIDLLQEQGYTHLLDLGLDDQPVWLRARQGRLLAIPYALELNDSSTQVGRLATAEQFAAMVTDQFDEMLEASEGQPLVMSVVLHAFISGQPFRLRSLRRVLEHMSARSEHVWFTTPGRIARLFEERPDLAV